MAKIAKMVDRKIRKHKYNVFVEKKKSVAKIIVGFLFSHIGLFFLCIGYAILGIKLLYLVCKLKNSR
jgi:hypothetical protein